MWIWAMNQPPGTRPRSVAESHEMSWLRLRGGNVPPRPLHQKNPDFTLDFITSRLFAVSWHSRCNRADTMNNGTDLTMNTEGQSTLGSDWVDTHADYLFNFAIGQLRDANHAEDLVQDTFLAAVKAQDGFRGKSSARTWLVGILRHKIYDYLRKTCRER